MLSLPLSFLAGVLIPGALSPATGTALPDGEPGRVRTYYIGADLVAWDYVPGGQDLILGKPHADRAFFTNGPPKTMSTSYHKVLYREYTDSNFTALKPVPPAWAHLGFLGPLLRAEVGDTIRIVFRNKATRPYSMHPHGVFYTKSSEGAPYNDGTSAADKADDAVPPGSSHVYLWPVPDRAGPTHEEGSSVMWMYHSHTDETRDVNTGLMGVIIVTAKGMAKPDGSPKDVDREIVADFAQVHEEDSWLADLNLPDNLNANPPLSDPDVRQNFYPWFVRFTINGFSYGSLPLEALSFKKGERVRWYLMSSTNDFDFHAPHWHGNTVVINHMRTDVTSISQMEMLIADMVPDNVGTWLFHCHVTFHNGAGMAVRYRVVD